MADRGSDARQERLADMLEEFRARRARHAEALAALEAVARTAREQVEHARKLHDEAVHQIKRLQTQRRRSKARNTRRKTQK